VLLLQGGADPQDPPANVANAVRELPNSRTVIVPGAGHGAIQHGCARALATRFVERGDAKTLDTTCIRLYRAPPFVIRP
jgi:pimeloyl-ACP methyl ester carboxylesterase